MPTSSSTHGVSRLFFPTSPHLPQAVLNTYCVSCLDLKRFWGFWDNFHRLVKLLLIGGQLRVTSQRLRKPGGSPEGMREVSFITIIY